MRQEYRPGEKLLVDYAGATLGLVDDGGEERKVEIFLAMPRASNYIFAEASAAQSLPSSWGVSHVRALDFFDRVPEACRYEPETARAFDDFARFQSLGTRRRRSRPPLELWPDNFELVAQMHFTIPLDLTEYF